MTQWEDKIETYLVHCSVGRGLSPHTVRNYRLDLEHYRRFLGKDADWGPREGTQGRAVLETYLEALGSKYKVATVRRRMACLRGFYSYLEERGHLKENPFHTFHIRLRSDRRRPNYLASHEVETLLRSVYRDERTENARSRLAIEEGDTSPICQPCDPVFLQLRDLVILEVLFATGLRVAELCGLRFDDYDPVTYAMRILGKGRRERMLFLGNQHVIRLFHGYMSARRRCPIDHEAIFITKFGQPMSTQAVRGLVEKHIAAAGIKRKVTPHMFRHSFATLLLESGVDIRYIQDFLGHSTIATTQIYLHVSDERKRYLLSHHHPREGMKVTAPGW